MLATGFIVDVNAKQPTKLESAMSSGANYQGLSTGWAKI
jgi:hypothetical protein